MSGLEQGATDPSELPKDFCLRFSAAKLKKLREPWVKVSDFKHSQLWPMATVLNVKIIDSQLSLRNESCV